MSGARAYLDWNATAPLRPEARTAMLAALEVCGNPSSVHAEGRRARAIVEEAREQVARLVGAAPADVVFTSGATEANNAVIAAGWDTVFAAGIEHDSVLAPTQAGAWRVIELASDTAGIADVAAIADAALRSARPLGRALVALQMANNETGVLQPVAATAAFARAHGLHVHTDAVQAAGRLTIDFRALGVDTMAISAHKLGGPKGVGALIVREGAPRPALLLGGGQERRRRAGTENVAGIAGFGAAAVAALADVDQAGRIGRQRDAMEEALLAATPDALIIGRDAPRLANTSAIALATRSAESLVIRLDLAGIAVSAGAACSSGKIGASRVLMAMGLPAEVARGAIRVSLGPTTSLGEIAAFLRAWREITGATALAA